MKTTFLILCSTFLLVMVYGEGIPKYQSTYFYLGYFAVPIFLSFCIAFICYQVSKLLSPKP